MSSRSNFPARGGGGPTPVPQALFDPAKPPAELVDGLAEEQADLFPNINKTQLRKFFGEVKDLYRQCQTGADYRAAIEPRFKMLRSKVAYASAKVGTAGSVPPSLKAFIDGAVKKVQTKDEFECFVKHFEAVVGFWFGKYADKRER